MDAGDRDLGMDRPIARRDFLNGVALATGGATAAGLVPGLAGTAHAADGAPPGDPMHPYRKTGLRGQYDGSYDVAHAVRNGTFDPGRVRDTGEAYDLVVVGGGISGLATAYFYRQAHPGARILVLEILDDFGGHAKRNEFTAPGERQRVIGYGGTQSIDGPETFTPQATRLLSDIGVRYEPFYDYFDRDFYDAYGLASGIFFDRAAFGRDELVVRRGDEPYAEFAARFPLPSAAREDLVRLHTTTEDFFPGLGEAEKKATLARMSYLHYLRDVAGIGEEAISVLARDTEGLWGLQVDAVSALDAWATFQPGFQGLDLDRTPAPGLGNTPRHYLESTSPYIFHFPDGNASVARLLVRALIPEVLPGSTQEDSVLARSHYAALDRRRNRVRIRLNSTVVRVAHDEGGRWVDVTYVRRGRSYRTRARRVVMACWNGMSSYLVDGLPQAQRDALLYCVKVPLIYTNVLIRNWEPFNRLGVRRVSTPGLYWHGYSLDFPVSMGGYQFSADPGEPIVLHLTKTPNKPGLSSREQHRAGRGELIRTPFTEFERTIREMLGRSLGAGGFDPARDITAITVNRWAHGYAYEYSSLWDPAIFRPEPERPYAVGRQRFGRIAFANSDSGAFAYTQSAIDQAYRAVQDLVG